MPMDEFEKVPPIEALQDGHGATEKRAEVNTEAEEAKIVLNAQINAMYVARSLSYKNEGFMAGMHPRLTRLPPKYGIDTLDLSSYIRRKCMIAGKEETLVYKLGVGYRGIPHARYEGPMDTNGGHRAVDLSPPNLGWKEFCPIGSDAFNNAIRYIEAAMRAFERKMESEPTQKDKPTELTTDEMKAIETDMDALTPDTSDPTQLTFKKAEESIPKGNPDQPYEPITDFTESVDSFVDSLKDSNLSVTEHPSQAPHQERFLEIRKGSRTCIIKVELIDGRSVVINTLPSDSGIPPMMLGGGTAILQDQKIMDHLEAIFGEHSSKEVIVE